MLWAAYKITFIKDKKSMPDICNEFVQAQNLPVALYLVKEATWMPGKYKFLFQLYFYNTEELENVS